MTAGVDLAARRREVERRLGELKRARGAALLDETPFDSSEIGRLETELDDIAAAEAEATRRMLAEVPVQRAREYADRLAEFRAAGDRRLDALARAEAAARALGGALAEIETAAEAMRDSASAMSNIARPGDFSSPTPLAKPNHEIRIAARLRAVLREALGVDFFGGSIRLAREAGDPDAAENWREAEAREVDVIDHFTKLAPTVPDDDDARAAA